MCASDVEVGKFHILNLKHSANKNGSKVLRDVSERGRDIEGVIKQWFGFVKPSYRKYVEPQRAISGLRFLVSLVDSGSNGDGRYYHPPWN